MEKEPEDNIKEKKKMFSPKRGRIVLFILLAVCLAAGWFWYMNLSYSSYAIQEKIDRSSAESSNYLSFEGNLLSYSRDGVTYSTYESQAIWNESFDMENPTLDKNEGYVLIYDRQHTGLEIFNKNGVCGKLSVNLPISIAKVAGNGNVAVLMQDKDTAYIKLYDTDAKELAEGELHAGNTGYPLSMDLSGDATKLMMSLADLSDGSIKSTICFFDFSKEGEKAKNHIVADFSYADLMVPEVSFVGDRAVAFGDGQLIFYETGKKIKTIRQVHVNEEIYNVFYSENRVGIITVEENADDKKTNTLHVYSTNGIERFSQKVSGNMTSVEFMDNGELLLHDGTNISVYTKTGRKKASLKTDENIRTVIPWDGQRNYYFITKNTTEKVTLR